MSTGYLVKCPHAHCNWFGELPAQPDPDAWREPVMTIPLVVFECPRCGKEWRARVIGNDIEALPVESAEELEPLAWPTVDLGVGD